MNAAAASPRRPDDLRRGALLMVTSAMLFALMGVAVVMAGAWARDRVRRERFHRNESAILGDLRIVISAQAAYAAANAGFYDSRLECLAKPWDCIPGYPRSAPAFLDADLASNDYVRRGYRRMFTSACTESPCHATRSRSRRRREARRSQRRSPIRSPGRRPVRRPI